MSSGKFWVVSPDPEQSATQQLEPIMKNGYYYKFGVFLDYDCRASKQYLDEVSASLYDGLSLSAAFWNVHHILNRQQTYGRKFLHISTDSQPYIHGTSYPQRDKNNYTEQNPFVLNHFPYKNIRKSERCSTCS
jgi:hypothetical protein